MTRQKSPSNVHSGDIDRDGQVTAMDIDALTDAIIEGKSPYRFDLNEDGSVDLLDHNYWVTALKKTWLGDANLDGSFSSSDLVAVFLAGQYELDSIAGWAEGDWTGDQRFGSSDLVAAFLDGGYEQGPRPAATIVIPEPTSSVILVVGSLAVILRRKRDR